MHILKTLYLATSFESQVSLVPYEDVDHGKTKPFLKTQELSKAAGHYRAHLKNE